MLLAQWCGKSNPRQPTGLRGFGRLSERPKPGFAGSFHRWRRRRWFWQNPSDLADDQEPYHLHGSAYCTAPDWIFIHVQRGVPGSFWTRLVWRDGHQSEQTCGRPEPSRLLLHACYRWERPPEHTVWGYSHKLQQPRFLLSQLGIDSTEAAVSSL